MFSRAIDKPHLSQPWAAPNRIPTTNLTWRRLLCHSSQTNAFQTFPNWPQILLAFGENLKIFLLTLLFPYSFGIDHKWGGDTRVICDHRHVPNTTHCGCSTICYAFFVFWEILLQLWFSHKKIVWFIHDRMAKTLRFCGSKLFIYSVLQPTCMYVLFYTIGIMSNVFNATNINNYKTENKN